MQKNESNGIQEASKLLSDSRSVSRRDFVKIAGLAAATVSLGGGLGGLVAGPVGNAQAATTVSAQEGTAVTAQAGPPPLAPPYVHGQDFSVITIGTSSPELSFERASSCSMIQYKGKYYTVDAGTGSVYGFMKAPPDAKGTTQYAYRDIRAMFFSHLHQDHTTNYFDIATIRWMTGGKEMLLAPAYRGSARVPDHLLEGRP